MPKSIIIHVADPVKKGDPDSSRNGLQLLGVGLKRNKELPYAKS